MLLLSLVLCIMAIAATVVLVRPLFVKDIAKCEELDVSRDSVNSVVFQDRLKELDCEVENGTLTLDEFELLKIELSKGLLGDVPNLEGSAVQGENGKFSRLASIVGLIVLLPSLSLGVYTLNADTSTVGDWLQLRVEMEPVFSALQAGEKPQRTNVDRSVGDFVTALQRKAQENPEDASLWHMLGMGYMQMKAGEEAEQALRRAYRVDPENLVYRFALAQLLINLDQGRLEAESERLLLGALNKNRENPQALAMLGMGYFFSEKYEPSLVYWQRLLTLSIKQNAPQEKIDLINKSIAAARNRLAQGELAVIEYENGNAVRVDVTVNISSELSAQYNPSDTLFIYAQHAKGPKMPLAVIRQPVSAFPVKVSLSDEQAMTPQFTLSSANSVIVKARISATSNAIPTSGDLQGESEVIDMIVVRENGGASLDVTISSRLP
ncbi:c-type cytochrome biogenesis protein CcmI [Gammaproteobacteria bacterium 45_16_T64]|nr:c-type cytochrome biogenesis protein CcmI [Gammaproteobacteria bacterium 45_16_T64]